MNNWKRTNPATQADIAGDESPEKLKTYCEDHPINTATLELFSRYFLSLRQPQDIGVSN
jgi:hypothetical protein